MSVFGRNQVSDKDLLKTVNQRLARTGTASQSKINVTVQQGMVTLVGSLQYAIQRAPILKAIERIPGVRRVVDQLQIIDRKSARHDADAHRFYNESSHAASAVPDVAPETGVAPSPIENE